MSVRPAQHSIWFRLYHGETAFDFVGRKWRWFILSGTVILVGIISLSTRGLNFGIDFKGGTAWEVPTSKVTVAQARDVMGSFGLADSKIQVATGSTGRVVRVEADLKGKSDKGPAPTERQRTEQAVSAKLAELAHVDVSQVNINDVGPSWGHEITAKAERALVIFMILITLYISVRFEWKMAVAAIAALVHDIAVTAGVYSLSGFQVTPATVIAFLTILGYSLYDTIVVFDKVEENTKGLAASGRLTYGDTVNLSMNQVLMRSLNTSLVAIMPILSILVIGAYVLGATTLKDFGLALFIGLTTGAYSSIFIASPLLAVLKEREPRYATIRQRVLARGGAAGPLTPAAAAAGGMTGSSVAVGGGGDGRRGGGQRARAQAQTQAQAQGPLRPGVATEMVAEGDAADAAPGGQRPGAADGSARPGAPRGAGRPGGPRPRGRKKGRRR